MRGNKSRLIIAVAALVVLLLFAWLIAKMAENDDHKEKSAKVIHNIHYVKDSKTGLCFAVSAQKASYQGYGYMAHVPCDKVEKYLE